MSRVCVTVRKNLETELTGHDSLHEGNSTGEQLEPEWRDRRQEIGCPV